MAGWEWGAAGGREEGNEGAGAPSVSGLSARGVRGAHLPRGRDDQGMLPVRHLRAGRRRDGAVSGGRGGEGSSSRAKRTQKRAPHAHRESGGKSPCCRRNSLKSSVGPRYGSAVRSVRQDPGQSRGRGDLHLRGSARHRTRFENSAAATPACGNRINGQSFARGCGAGAAGTGVKRCRSVCRFKVLRWDRGSRDDMWQRIAAARGDTRLLASGSRVPR